ncbi:MAG TPA: type II toxin-antitoxin system RelE/ParE family toxin [Spirochaetota bacterium]|nr:type II toxin-antitoxin system RelE/ParE family toxin [Spirochaetota bacterium]HPP49602.1 type II toxin-antitoxin system RelE/ParE family toxin [Spirochaetota bacterium]
MTLEPKYKYGGILIVEADKKSGEKFDIIAAQLESGNCPFWDYFCGLKHKYEESLRKRISLKKDDQINFSKLHQYFDKFCRTGHWYNERQIKKIEDGFFEFKIMETGLRVIFYYDELNKGVIILTHTFLKKKDKMPQKERERMYFIKDSFEKMRRR